MPSTHIVPIVEIQCVKPHPNADKLEIAIVDGWQVVVGKEEHNLGDRMVFVPVDSLVPEEWADKWGVRQYLGGSNHDRVKCVRLRGEPSYGFLVAPPLGLIYNQLGEDVKDFFGIKKYEPPVRGHSGPNCGHSCPSHPLFDKYTNIENLRNNTRVFTEGEQVVVTEKIHGCNARVGLVDTVQKRKDIWSRILRLFGKNRIEVVEEFVVGSHNVQRRVDWKNLDKTAFTLLLTHSGIINFLNWAKDQYYMTYEYVPQGIKARKPKQILVYGEIYGPSIQKLKYGVPEGKTKFAIFDIKVDGKYLDWETVWQCGNNFEIEVVPWLMDVKEFNMQKIMEVSEGPSLVTGADNIREGVVVRPVREARHHKTGRKILKCKGATYLEWSGKGEGRDFTEV